MNNLARNMAVLRRASGLSQEKAAEAVGVTRQALAKWEAGETTCSTTSSAPAILRRHPGASTSSAWCRWGSGDRS